MADDDLIYALDDPQDPWFGDDKVSHWLGGAFVGSLCHTRGLPLTLSLGVVFVLAVAVECSEVRRYGLWQARGAPIPWPWHTDKASVKDVLYGILGALCGYWLASVLRVNL